MFIEHESGNAASQELNNIHNYYVPLLIAAYLRSIIIKLLT